MVVEPVLYQLAIATAGSCSMHIHLLPCRSPCVCPTAGCLVLLLGAAASPHRFHLMGGECNYLLRVNAHSKHLEFVPDEEWMTPEMLAWDDHDIKVRDWILLMRASYGSAGMQTKHGVCS
eukprot:GHRQ01034285.1.p2 GENE.GHRQ01034285.1~~GHRQ01034285.1.p2  ORF type:complete len:120 (-),score=40.92 GHRQ01034285.1:249-608(-)